MTTPFVAITPADVQQMGLIGDLSAPVGGPLSYLIWNIPTFSFAATLSRGIRELGFVSLQFHSNGLTESLTARQHLLFENGGNYCGACDLRMEAECRADVFHSLQTWALKTEFTRRDGVEPLAPWTETGKVDAAGLHLTRDQVVETASGSPPVQVDVGFLGFIGSLPASFSKSCTVLNMDGTVAGDQVLETLDAPEPDSGGTLGALRRSVCWGPGRLPWNYWSNAAGQVVMAASNSTVLVLEAQAEARCRERSAAWIYGSRTGGRP